jgi:hypothetical protein
VKIQVSLKYLLPPWLGLRATLRHSAVGNDDDDTRFLYERYLIRISAVIPSIVTGFTCFSSIFPSDSWPSTNHNNIPISFDAFINSAFACVNRTTLLYIEMPVSAAAAFIPRKASLMRIGKELKLNILIICMKVTIKDYIVQ